MKEGSHARLGTKVQKVTRGGGSEILGPVTTRAARIVERMLPQFVSLPVESKRAIFRAGNSPNNRCVMVAYLTLSDDEWETIRPILPVPKRGPKRPHDRSTCAAFLFARAAGVSLESLPLGQFPDSGFLRTTWARWEKTGTLPKLFAVGAKVQARMERQYDAYISDLTLDGERVTGKATETLPRWTHVRQS